MGSSSDSGSTWPGSKRSSPSDKRALERRYTVERELDEGGMATVYLAEDSKHERKVAIKVLKPELAAIVGGERFLAEIRTTANLQHPHTLPLHDSGEAGNRRPREKPPQRRQRRRRGGEARCSQVTSRSPSDEVSG